MQGFGLRAKFCAGKVKGSILRQVDALGTKMS
jgi:hypothetical protein